MNTYVHKRWKSCLRLLLIVFIMDNETGFNTWHLSEIKPPPWGHFRSIVLCNIEASYAHPIVKYLICITSCQLITITISQNDTGCRAWTASVSVSLLPFLFECCFYILLSLSILIDVFALCSMFNYTYWRLCTMPDVYLTYLRLCTMLDVYLYILTSLHYVRCLSYIFTSLHYARCLSIHVDVFVLYSMFIYTYWRLCTMLDVYLYILTYLHYARCLSIPIDVFVLYSMFIYTYWRICTILDVYLCILMYSLKQLVRKKPEVNDRILG